MKSENISNYFTNPLRALYNYIVTYHSFKRALFSWIIIVPVIFALFSFFKPLQNVIQICYYAVMVLLPVGWFLQREKFINEMEKKGLVKYNENWIKISEYNKIIEKQNFLGKYSARCRDCEYAYYKKSIYSIKCPNCGSKNIEQ